VLPLGQEKDDTGLDEGRRGGRHFLWGKNRRLAIPVLFLGNRGNPEDRVEETTVAELLHELFWIFGLAVLRNTSNAGVWGAATDVPNLDQDSYFQIPPTMVRST